MGKDRLSAARAKGAIVLCLLGSVAMVGVLLEWEDELVLALVIAVVRGLSRKMEATASVLPTAAAARLDSASLLSRHSCLGHNVA